MAKNLFTNKTIFITGGTGSFGSFFVKKILGLNPKKIIVFSRDEDKQYWLQNELKNERARLKFGIGDFFAAAGVIRVSELLKTGI